MEKAAAHFRRRSGRQIALSAALMIGVMLLSLAARMSNMTSLREGGLHVTAIRGLFAANHVTLISPNESPQEKPATSADEKTIRQILVDQERAWNRGDLEAFMAGYWKSPELSFYSGRDKQRGWQQTFDRYKQRYQGNGKEMGKLTFSELQVERIGQDVAIIRGRWKLDKSKESIDGLFTLVFKKLTEGWRIVHDHTSAGEPEAVRNPRP